MDAKKYERKIFRDVMEYLWPGIMSKQPSEKSSGSDELTELELRMELDDMEFNNLSQSEVCADMYRAGVDFKTNQPKFRHMRRGAGSDFNISYIITEKPEPAVAEGFGTEVQYD